MDVEPLAARSFVALFLVVNIVGMKSLDVLYPTQQRAEPVRWSARVALGILATASRWLLWLLQLAGWDLLGLHTRFDPAARLAGVVLLAGGAVGAVWVRLVRQHTWGHSERHPSNITGHAFQTYGFVRHPFYLCLWLSFVGIELAFASWLVLVAVPYLVVLGRIADHEEKDLRTHYGEPWVAYTKRTPWKLLPFVY